MFFGQRYIFFAIWIEDIEELVTLWQYFVVSLYMHTIYTLIGNFHSTCYQSLRSATLFLYALHNVTMTMPLENRMRTPHNLQRMLILNVSFNVFIVHDIRVPRLQQMHARCLRHCSQESSQESVDVPYAKIRSIFIFLKNFTLMKFKTSVILIQSLK
ncbi:uncharacterized protein LOC102654066 isoform X3 [Apis mellifera]|nr:uncharacterized protein LOC102654066 isoform X3 [Apis mellifera]|eukprot:XP_026296121.1 uncharacterized protein LOC102654066 isoform X3 [Apis mellifera]